MTGSLAERAHAWLADDPDPDTRAALKAADTARAQTLEPPLPDPSAAPAAPYVFSKEIQVRLDGGTALLVNLSTAGAQVLSRTPLKPNRAIKMVLESTARYIGPGHAAIMNDNGTNWFTFHYYDGNDNGNRPCHRGNPSRSGVRCAGCFAWRS